MIDIDVDMKAAPASANQCKNQQQSTLKMMLW